MDDKSVLLDAPFEQCYLGVSLLSYVVDYVLLEMYNSVHKRYEAWIVPTSSKPVMVDWLVDSYDTMFNANIEMKDHDIKAIPDPYNSLNFPTKGKIIQLPSLSGY